MKILCLLAGIALLGFSACQAHETEFEAGVVDRFDFFSLDIGHLENQLALFAFEGYPAMRTGMALRDGMLYISDGNGGKIVRYNFFGDLLFMIFNEDTNPRPISLSTNFAEGEHATRWAIHYPLKDPGRIVVDSRRHIFVEERLPPERVRFDQENNVVLDAMLLHFDQNGNFIQYLGQDGIGGTPFPRIVGLYASGTDEIVVVSRLPGGWNIFWFDPSGALLYLIMISSSEIPMLPEMDQALGIVDRIVAVPDSRQLLIKVDYYKDILGDDYMRLGKELYRSLIWTLNVEDGSYIAYTDVPHYTVPGDTEGVLGKMIYSMLGVMPNGIALLYFPIETGHSILFLNTITGEQRRGVINFSSSQLVYHNFSISPEGMLLGILVDDYQVNLVSWRTDVFLIREEAL
ncbi:MAG: hypothetical protein FWG66_16015 [Spirochaetes bacterium]|nr:hypothetical protein [Spirochaetota bacterium]